MTTLEDAAPGVDQAEWTFALALAKALKEQDFDIWSSRSVHAYLHDGQTEQERTDALARLRSDENRDDRDTVARVLAALKAIGPAR